MAANITDYCTADNIRSVLGISVDEVDDNTVLDMNFAVRLQERLYDLSPTLADYYATIKLLPTPTTDQSRLLDMVSSFASYVVAQAIAETGANSIPVSIEDGKAKLERYRQSFKDLTDTLNKTLAYLTTKITALYTKLEPGVVTQVAVTPIYMVNVGLASDPVTGV